MKPDERLSVVLVAPLYPPQAGGAATYFRMLARFLAGQDDVGRVAVIAPYVRGEPLARRVGRLGVYRMLPPRPGPRQALAVRLLNRMATDLALLAIVAWLALARGYRVVHVHANFASIGARVANLPLAVLLRGLPVRAVLDVRDAIVPVRRSGAWSQVICASQAIYQRAVRAGVPAARCLYVPTPIDRDAIDAAAMRGRQDIADVTARRPYLCYAGAISRAKGVRELVDGFALYRQRHPEAGLSLVLVGPGAEAVSMPHGVVFAGARPWDGTVATIAGAELLVVPSYPGKEGIPRVCLEALSLGTRVVLPPGVDEFDRTCPDAVLPDVTPASIAAAIDAALGRTGPSAYDLAPHDAQTAFARYLDVYRGDAG